MRRIVCIPPHSARRALLAGAVALLTVSPPSLHAEAPASGASQADRLANMTVILVSDFRGPVESYKDDGDPATLEVVDVSATGGKSSVSANGQVLFLATGFDGGEIGDLLMVAMARQTAGADSASPATGPATASPSPATGQPFANIGTSLPWEAVEGEGAQLRRVMDAAMTAQRSGDLALADSRFREVATWCDQQKQQHQGPVLSTTTIEERAVLEAREPPGASILWVDLACPSSHMQIAYLAADRGDAETALAELDRAVAFAPLWAQPYTERGYTLNQLGRPADALGPYLKAVELARAYPGSRPVLPLALRGLGFTLIELNELDEAEKQFKESLTLEPGNATALNELKYIEQVRAERARAGAGGTRQP